MTRRRTENAAETEALGAEIAASLDAGDVVLVSGELGAGKTTLVRGAVRALGVTEPVVSPTFTIGRRYRGRLLVSHLDLYRLAEPAGEEPGLLEDYLAPEAVAFVEWPEVGSDALSIDPGRIARRIRIRHAGGDRRDVEVDPPDQAPSRSPKPAPPRW